MDTWQRWKQTTIANKLLAVSAVISAVFTGVTVFIFLFQLHLLRLQTQIIDTQTQDTIQQRIDNFRPIIVFEVVDPYKLAIRNIGKGPALDIELRLSQVHQNGGLTNLRNLVTDDVQRDLLNLGESERIELSGADTIRTYAFAQAPEWQWGQRDVFAAIATYSDINRRPYYTISLIRTFPNGAERKLVLKNTKTANYESGNIERLNVLDWFR